MQQLKWYATRAGIEARIVH